MGHAPHPLADGRNHRGDAISGPRARGLGGAGGRCRRYGVPVGSRWAARGRYFVRVTKVRGASGGRFTTNLRHDLIGAWLDHHRLPHITLYDPRPLGRPACPHAPCGKPRRAVGPNHRFGGEWRAMVYCFMVCDHTAHPTCTATTAPPTPTSLVYTRPAPGFEPRRCHNRPLRLHPKGCRWRGLILRSGCLSEVLRVVQLARTFLTQNKPPPPAPCWVGAEGASVTPPGARTRALAVCIPGMRAVVVKRGRR